MQPTRPSDGTVLASYPRYTDAQTAVDRLSDARFPVERTSIVGRDLRLVETVTGRLNWGRAALSGLATGAWFGLLVGLWVLQRDRVSFRTRYQLLTVSSGFP